MEQKDKKLLLKDLSARLCYGVMIHIEETNESEELYCLNIPQEGLYTRNKEHHNISSLCPIEQAKPYLRSLSSMTEEERKELELLVAIEVDNAENEDEDASEWCLYDRTGILNVMGGARFYFDEMIHVYDWLYQHHFDFRGLISLGLALEAPKGMYE